MSDTAFITEAREWLSQFGYSVHSYNSDKTSITFVSDSPGNNNPSITCWINSHGKYCELSYSGLKLFIGLTSHNIQFKHPDIGRYIKAMQHYATVCENNNPFNSAP